MGDNLMYFALWTCAICIVFSLAALVEHVIEWFTIDRDGEVIEIHANKANPL